MKKFLLTAITALAALTASAADRVVYQNGALGNYDVYGWWNEAVDFGADNPAGDGKVMSFKAADGGAAASMGIYGKELGPLHSSTLNFKWYATTAGQEYHVRLTSRAEQDYVITTTAENAGRWNTVSLSVEEVFPEVAAGWNAYDKNGEGYVFGLTMDRGTAESVLYVNDIIYTNIDEAWEKPFIPELPAPTTVPVPAHAAADVVSVLSGSYPAATTFGIGGWGQSTSVSDVTVDGVKTLKITDFNYLGWELTTHLDVTACTSMHVDFFAANAGSFGFTPISPGHERGWIADVVKVGEWNSYDVPLSYFTDVNFADVFQIKFDQGNGQQEGYIANVYFYKDANIKLPEYGGVWYGHAEGECTKGEKNYFITVDYAFTANEDGTIGIELTIDGEDDLEAGHQIHIVKAGVGDEWVTLTKNGDVWTGKTTTLTFAPGDAVAEMEIYMPYAGGVFHPFVRDYVFGASNEKPVVAVAPRLTASVANVTAFGAELSYEVTLPAELTGAAVTVYYNNETASGSPVVLSSLIPNTEYTYTLYATATLDGETYESKPVTVTFRTLRDGATAAVWHAIADGMISNAYLPGEDESMRRDIPVSIETTITYNADQTITIDAVFHGETVVGFVPKVTVTTGEFGFERQPMTLDGDHYTITTNVEYPMDRKIDWLYFAIAYAGGESLVNLNGLYTTGEENDAPAYGAPASISLTLSSSMLKVGGTAIATAVVKDNAGHYLLDEDTEIKVDSAAFTVNGAIITAQDRGTATVTASYGELKATAEIKCVTTAEAIDLTTLEGVTCTASSGNVDLAFDKNEGSQIEWNCSESEEHSVTVDFGTNVSVQAIELVWEGASATHYTVSLVAAEEPAARRVASYSDNVFTVENGAGGAGVTARETLYPEDFSAIKAAKIDLKTNKAFNAGWGIKLKEMYVYGTKLSATGLEAVEATEDDAPFEYFNLQGVRVDNPAAGIFIRRQGSNVTKVTIR